MKPESATSTETSTMSDYEFFATAAEHLRLTVTDGASIRVFLRAYEQFKTEIKELAKQLFLNEHASSHIFEPVQLKRCVNFEWLESLFSLSFITDVADYDTLTDTVFRKYLEYKAK